MSLLKDHENLLTMVGKTAIMERSNDIWNLANTNTKQPPAWFLKELTELDEETREVFEKYSGLSPDAVIPHIVEVVCESFCYS